MLCANQRKQRRIRFAEPALQLGFVHVHRFLVRGVDAEHALDTLALALGLDSGSSRSSGLGFLRLSRSFLVSNVRLRFGVIESCNIAIAIAVPFLFFLLDRRCTARTSNSASRASRASCASCASGSGLFGVVARDMLKESIGLRARDRCNKQAHDVNTALRRAAPPRARFVRYLTIICVSVACR